MKRSSASSGHSKRPGSFFTSRLCFPSSLISAQIPEDDVVRYGHKVQNNLTSQGSLVPVASHGLVGMKVIKCAEAARTARPRTLIETPGLVMRSTGTVSGCASKIYDWVGRLRRRIGPCVLRCDF